MPLEGLASGTVLKHWVLGKRLGSGAFGDVYDARAISDPTVRVAIKVVLLRGAGASKLKKSSQSREAAMLNKEYNLYTGEPAEAAPIYALIPDCGIPGGRTLLSDPTELSLSLSRARA